MFQLYMTMIKAFGMDTCADAEWVKRDLKCRLYC
jgi:hypothetical protein